MNNNVNISDRVLITINRSTDKIMKEGIKMKEQELGFIDSIKEIKLVKIGDCPITSEVFAKWFIDEIKDIAIDEDSYISMLGAVKPYTGLYKRQMILYLIEFINRFPMITKKGIDKIAGLYVKDLFDEKDISDQLATIKEMDDHLFDKYLLDIQTRYTAYMKYLDTDMKEMEEILIDYPEQYKMVVNSLMEKDKILLDKILPYIPTKDIVVRDMGKLLELATYYRIDFGVGSAACITALKSSIIEGKPIEETSFDKMNWFYELEVGDVYKQIPLCFTKEEYRASVQEKNGKAITYIKR